MLKKCLLSGLLLLTAAKVFPSVEMKCVSVAANGDATITWTNYGSSTFFHAYYIYHSSLANGPFALTDSILSYATQTYTDLVVNANVSQAFYYIIIKSTSGADVSSDTIQAIMLSVLNIGNNGYSTLNWNLTHTPRYATNSPYYKIYRKYTVGGWVLTDSVDIRYNPPSYLEEITICADTVKYRIEVDDNSGCTSVSNVDGKFFRDVRPPQIPIVDSVSVNSSGFAMIGWQQNPSVDTKKYVVLELINGNWIQVGDTLYGIDSTFLQTTVGVSTSSQQFRVLAIDSCGNPSAMSLPHRTLLVNGTLNNCTATFQLTWNSYINSAAPPLYKIIMNENGGQDSILTVTTSTAFLVSGLIADSNYCFHIIALLGGSSTSTSTSVCITPNVPVAPVFSYIRKVTVPATNMITVEAFIDTAADINNYSLSRSVSPSSGFHTIATIAAPGSPFISFNDFVTTNRIYYYVVASLDSCGYNSLSSQISHSIFLDVQANENYTNTLTWNNYELWDGGISRYVIFRDVDDAGVWTPITTILFGADTTYLDVISDDISANGKFCYKIMAIEGSGNPYGFTDTAYSNDACVQQQTAVFIPNAFHPGGAVNRVFIPSNTFLSNDDYHLKIYNRFGGLIFESTSPSVGWDGTFFGHSSPEGVYIYYFSAKSGAGDDIKKTGLVTLVR